MTTTEPGALSPSQRRLQREPDFTGDKLASFREVALRHGIPGALLGLAFFALPQTRGLLDLGSPSSGSLLQWITAACLIFVALNLYAWFIDRSWRLEKAGWVLYLGAVSAWEEWVFRLALPYLANDLGMRLMHAAIISNAIFAAAHYFTLRWKWPWCVGAFLGGLALSREFADHQNLVLIIYIHWIATFLNTPRLPGTSRRQ